MPLVSVITPSYNQDRFIEDTLLSIKSQDYPNIEHIVVDGSSTDSTLEILKTYENKYNLKWISEPDKGPGDAINKGFKMSKGEIIGWLNSDDVYFTKDVISYVVKQFKLHQYVDVIYGNDVSITANNYIFGVRRVFNWNYKKLLRGLTISQPSTFFRREVISQNPLPVREIWLAFDFEYWLKIGKRYKFLQVKKILAGNRIYGKRGTILYRGKTQRIKRELKMKYGQESDIKYYLFRYFFDLPQLQIKKFLGVKDLLNIKKNSSELAFRGNYKSMPILIFTQVSPVSLLMKAGII